MEGKVIVVTGAFGALGRVVVEAAMERGASTVALDFAPARARRSSPGFGPRALILAGGQSRLVRGGAERDGAVKARFGRLDALVNIAGGFLWEKTEDGTQRVGSRCSPPT